MDITKKKFEEYLALYGAEVDGWPEEIRAEAVRISRHPIAAEMINEQRRFEEILRDGDITEPAGAWLAERIINAARNKAPAVDMVEWLQDLLAAVLPRPAFALATVLTLGLVIGFGLPVVSGENVSNPGYLEDAAL